MPCPGTKASVTTSLIGLRLQRWMDHIIEYTYHINPLRAKFFRESINIYLHFVSYLHIDMTQVVEILPQIRQEPTYST